MQLVWLVHPDSPAWPVLITGYNTTTQECIVHLLGDMRGVSTELQRQYLRNFAANINLANVQDFVLRERLNQACSEAAELLSAYNNRQELRLGFQNNFVVPVSNNRRRRPYLSSRPSWYCIDSSNPNSRRSNCGRPYLNSMCYCTGASIKRNPFPSVDWNPLLLSLHMLCSCNYPTNFSFYDVRSWLPNTNCHLNICLCFLSTNHFIGDTTTHLLILLSSWFHGRWKVNFSPSLTFSSFLLKPLRLSNNHLSLTQLKVHPHSLEIIPNST